MFDISPKTPPREIQPRFRGQVLVLTLIALVALVGLVMFVYNVGHQVNRRSDLQNTADATATAGASWMSRSMNVVSMNNIAQARLLSLVPVLDAVPLTAEITLQEMILDAETNDSLPMGLRRQLDRGVPDDQYEQAYAPPSRLDGTVADAVLFMPADEPEIEPAWPLSNAVRARIQAVGTVVDNASPGFSADGRWRRSDAVNEYGGSSLDTFEQGATATWAAALPGPGRYDVYAWWSSTRDGLHRDREARYRFGNRSVTRDQNRNCGTWIMLGTTGFSRNDDGEVVARVTVERTSKGENPDSERVNFLRTGLEKLYQQMTPEGDEEFVSQFDALEQLDEALDSEEEKQSDGGYDIGQTTRWDPGSGLSGRGELWEAMITLDEASQATMAAAGVLAQADAVRFGEANGADTAAAVPVEPKVPAKRGEFEDFFPLLVGRFSVTSDGARLEMPIDGLVDQINRISEDIEQLEEDIEQLQDELLEATDPQEQQDLEQRIERLIDELLSKERRKEDLLGSLHNRGRGGAIPDWEYPHRLGPFARLFRWRHHIRERVDDGGEQSEPGWEGDPEVGAPRRGGGGSWRTIGYRTYGPYWWAMRRMHSSFGLVGRREGPADVSRFVANHRLISNIKLGYLFGLQEPQTIKYARRWITDYAEAREYAADSDRRRRIIRTRYYWPVVMSSVSFDSDNWLKDPNTYWSPQDEISPPDDPKSALWVREFRGWRDVQSFRPQAERVTDYVWRWARSYEDVIYEPRLNIHPRYDSDTGDEIPWSIYICSWYVFGGIEVYEETVDVSNPFNWSNGLTLPAPMLLDTSDGDYEPSIPSARTTPDPQSSFRRDYFTLLGIARKRDTAPVWPQRFYSADPTDTMLTVAQAQMFNNKSFGLWTQDWQQQLMPVTGWSDWTDRLQLSASDADKLGDMLSEQELREIEKYLSALQGEMQEIFTNH
ncbi:MAG: pilus assembly protein TadG-related protein [Planctomycetota bacterium]